SGPLLSRRVHFFKTFFSHPIDSTVLSLSCFSRSLPFGIQIRGHIAGTPPPSPLRCMYLLFLSREEFSIFSPLRLAPNCAHTRYLVPVGAFCRSIFPLENDLAWQVSNMVA
ncbi:unnamed protein product, partial [Laminaria digitata]